MPSLQTTDATESDRDDDHGCDQWCILCLRWPLDDWAAELKGYVSTRAN